MRDVYSFLLYLYIFPPNHPNPRWATIGVYFKTLACAPRQLAHMSPTNFESLRKLMNRSLDHVIGEAPPIMGPKSKFNPPPSSPQKRPPHSGRPNKKTPVLKSAISDPHTLRMRMENVLEVEERVWEVREGEGEGERFGKIGEEGEGEGEGRNGGDEACCQLQSTPSRGKLTHSSTHTQCSIVHLHTYVYIYNL